MFVFSHKYRLPRNANTATPLRQVNTGKRRILRNVTRTFICQIAARIAHGLLLEAMIARHRAIAELWNTITRMVSGETRRRFRRSILTAKIQTTALDGEMDARLSLEAIRGSTENATNYRYGAVAFESWWAGLISRVTAGEAGSSVWGMASHIYTCNE